MIRSFRQRLTAWLCLGVAFLTGVTPASGMTLCLEPDGCVSIELSASAPDCGACCDQHADGDESDAPSMRGVKDAGCDCVDLPVPGSAQELRVQPKPLEFQFGPWIAAAPPIARLSLAVSALVERAPIEVPRPPGSVALIRTVVLLV